jgi:DNA-binding transcriptional LysR family regulator
VRWRLDQLEALVWIARLGSFRAAARKLNVSQPAVSGRIRELERVAGVSVIDRSGSRPRVTRRGTEMVRYAEQIMRLSDALASRVQGRQELLGTIRMGVADGFAVTHLPALLERFAQRHPAADVELDIDFSANLDRKLRAQMLDIAFLHAPTPDPTICIDSLTRFELAWFASPRLRLPKRGLRPADLVDVPILSNPRPSHLYSSILEWFGAAGLAPQRVNTCTSLSVITRLAVDGFGIALLPIVLAASELKARKLHELRTRPGLQPSHLTVAYRTDPELGDLASVAELAREVVGRA